MSHSGLGCHHHHHHHHHAGHGGGQIINAVSMLGLLQGVYVALFGTLSHVPGLKRIVGNKVPTLSGLKSNDSLEWEVSNASGGFLYRLMRMDLRPLIILAIFAGGAYGWLSMVYWLRHKHDRTGVVYGQFKTRDMVLAPRVNTGAAHMLPPQLWGMWKSKDYSPMPAGTPTPPGLSGMGKSKDYSRACTPPPVAVPREFGSPADLPASAETYALPANASVMSENALAPAGSPTANMARQTGPSFAYPEAPPASVPMAEPGGRHRVMVSR